MFIKIRIPLLLFTLFTIVALKSAGQDTTYFQNNGDKVNSLAAADYYAVLQQDPADSNKVTAKTYFKSGNIRSEKYYSDYNKAVFDGKFKAYYENGQLRHVIDFKNGKIDGQILAYWKDGKPKRIDHFKNDKFIKGKCFNADGKLIPHTPFERMPEFPGGETGMIFYLRRKIRYPKKARKNRIEGTVVVQFVVDKDGSITNAKVFKSVSPDLDQEALKVVKEMPKWKPGIQDGEPVSVQYSLPVRFQLQ